MKKKRSPRASRPARTKKKNSPAKGIKIRMSDTDNNPTKAGAKAGKIVIQHIRKYPGIKKGALETESKYRLIADNTYDFEFLIGPHGRFDYVSPSCQRLTGYPPKDFLADPGLFRSIIHPDDLKAFDRHRREVKKHIAGKTEWRLVKKNGSLCWIEHLCQPVYSNKGEYLGERGSNRDVSERKKMEEDLRDSERKFAKIFQGNAAAIVLTRLCDGIILDVNKKWQEFFGFTRQEVVGKTAAYDFLVWRYSKERRRIISDLETKGTLHNRECEFIKKDGTMWTALLSAEVIQLQGEPVILSSLLDITETKRIMEENHSLARFPSENPNPVLRLSPKGVILYANEASKDLLELWHCDKGGLAPKELQRTISRVFSDRYQQTIDIECQDRTYSFIIVPFIEAGYVNIYGRDVTGKKLAETALRLSEERYRSLFEKMTVGFALHEIVCNKKGIPVDYRFLEINPAFERLTGLKRTDIIGKLKNDVLPGDDPKWIKIYGEVALSGKPVHFDNFSPALKKHYDVLAYSPAPGQFAVFFTDVSEQRQKGEELQKLNRTLKALSNSSQAMMQASNEAKYLAKICRIIVTDCGYKMAWIGYSKNDKEKSIRPAAHAGFEKGYLENLNLTWADKERGRGPTGTAIRTGKPVICRNMLEDPRFAPWREEARRRGYISSLALPLLAEGRAIGAITIYSQEADPFLEAEVELLGELAERSAYGIKALRLRQEHAQAEESLRETSNYLEKLLNYANAPIIVWDHSFRIIRFNHAFERLTGYTIDRVQGKPLDILFPAANKNKSLKLIRDTLKGRHWEIVEIPILQKGGAIRTVLWNSANIQDKNGKIVATIAQGQDITERKQMEEALRRSESILHSFFDSPGIRREIIDVIDEADIRHIASNRETAKYYGLTTEAMQDKTSTGLGESPETVRFWIDCCKKSRLSRQPVSFEFPLKRGDQEIWQSVVVTYLGRISRGQHRFSQVIIDISERKRMEKALQESTNYLENLLNYANAPIIVWDPSFRIIRFNHAFERLTGHSAEQVHGKPLDILFPAAGKNELLKLIRDTLTGRHWEIVEIPILQKSGDMRTVLWNSANIHDKDGAVIATIAQGQDITERKQTEERVAASLHEKEILLRELYHRTKNNMNVISSLVMLQGSTVKDPAVLRMFSDMQSRIHAMSLVHEKLYQSSDLFNLDIREYINDLAGTILAGYKNSVARISLNLDIESVPFSIDTALPCGLVINELMTNSLKYAFSEEMTGEIGISLRLSPENEVTLHYHDNGIGFPDGFDPLKASSLGLKLINNLVKKQLLGMLEFKTAPGVWAVIRFKKTNIEKPERT